MEKVYFEYVHNHVLKGAPKAIIILRLRNKFQDRVND